MRVCSFTLSMIKKTYNKTIIILSYIKSNFSLTINFFLLVIIFTFFNPANISYSNEIKEVKIAWEDGLKPPYLMLENEELTGIAVELVNEILKRNQITTTNIILPWVRCLMELKNGNVELVPNSSYKLERTKYAIYSEPLYQTHLVLFYNKDRFLKVPIIKNIADLARYYIGGVFGFNYSYLKNKVKIDTNALNREVLVNNLRYNRYDFIIAQKEVILSMSKKGIVTIDELAYIPDILDQGRNYHILISKKFSNKEKLKKIIDDGIKELKTDGTYKKISNKYLGDY